MKSSPPALDRLGDRYDLDEPVRWQLAGLLALLEHDARAPTAVRKPERAVDVHVADSLVALEVPAVRAAEAIVDLGAGAGFPGLVLAIALRAATVWLLDSHRRKCEFVRATALAVGIENARAVCARAEEWQDGRGAHDLALARAVGPQAVVLEYAAPLLRAGGVLVDWRGRRDEAEEQAALRAADELGLSRLEVRRVEPFADAKDRHLHLFAKVQETPQRFPRRAGMARKRPLGRSA